MGNEILEITKEELDDSLIEMLLESANESYSQESLEDSLDYVRAVLARHGQHLGSKRALIKYLSTKLRRQTARISVREREADWRELLQILKSHPRIPLDEEIKAQLGAELIDQLIDSNPLLFLSLSQERIDMAIPAFRRRACYYVAQEYSRYRTAIQPEDLKTRIDRILSALESKPEPVRAEPSVYVQELQLAPEGLQPGTLSASVLVCFLLISLAFASGTSPVSHHIFLEAIDAAVSRLQTETKINKDDLLRTKAMLQRFLSR